MEIGMALPTMARDFSRATFVDWCRGIDEGPYSSISAGERVTFHNPELLVTTAAAAALTERVRVITNLVVLPLHRPAMIAQQLATIDVLSGGRLTVGVGVGGRELDYQAVGVPFAGRHAKLDAMVEELVDLWAGTPPHDGGQSVGPPVVQQPHPPLLAGTMGPKGMARAAVWADGVTGFSIGAEVGEIASTNRLADEAWATAGRSLPPRKVNGTFFLLAGADPARRLHDFAATYLGWFGERTANALADLVRISDDDALLRTLDAAEKAGCDEFILVPGTVDLSCLERATKVVGRWG
jgi:alkanesulfonate monooxygenase SsuD/methylene tetrahydromethanopterin reductase-like flavin-dependent oxidoreductase (luciferase family)